MRRLPEPEAPRISLVLAQQLLPSPRRTRRRISLRTHSMHRSLGIWLQAEIRIARKISALRDCQLRTSSSALRIPQMARKTVQIKFVSGNIARIRFSPIKEGTLPQFQERRPLIQHRKKSYPSAKPRAWLVRTLTSTVGAEELNKMRKPAHLLIWGPLVGVRRSVTRLLCLNCRGTSFKSASAAGKWARPSIRTLVV
jgi:hypothetical protein